MSLSLVLTAALPWVQWGAAITLVFISGIAWCFNLWVVPIIRLNESLSAFVQMQEMSRRGEAWLKPGSQFLVALLALTALATWSTSEAPEAEKWWCYAAASFTLAQIAWWEYVTIFALDEEILAMNHEKRDCKDGDRQALLDKDSRERLHGLMNQWSLRHSVRATLPLAAGLLALAPKVIRT